MVQRCDRNEEHSKAEGPSPLLPTSLVPGNLPMEVSTEQALHYVTRLLVI